jgi:hypothetical protein
LSQIAHYPAKSIAPAAVSPHSVAHIRVWVLGASRQVRVGEAPANQHFQTTRTQQVKIPFHLQKIIQVLLLPHHRQSIPTISRYTALNLLHLLSASFLFRQCGAVVVELRFKAARVQPLLGDRGAPVKALPEHRIATSMRTQDRIEWQESRPIHTRAQQCMGNCV